ncbi:MAG: cytochrome c [Cyclobacteriaceae bacterium]
MTLKTITNLALFGVLVYALSSCAAKGDYPGVEYAPQMYHSVPYEGLAQVKDKDAGNMITSIDGPGEFYTSNPNNPNEMNMREPVANTVPRNKKGYLPYKVEKDSLTIAAAIPSPLDSADTEVLKHGKVLYERFCQHCHGAQGKADGKVAEKFLGVANLTGLAYQNITEGHIFHVITHGKGLMGAHGSQISPEERWKIARYVKKLQQ